jgi:hypothetical protein
MPNRGLASSIILRELDSSIINTLINHIGFDRSAAKINDLPERFVFIHLALPRCC